MGENKKVLFIINKFSGQGFNKKIEGRILTRCAELGFEATLEFTQGRGHAMELSKAAAESHHYEIVFAVGGDGTVNEVAKGVAHTPQAMGILPAGSGNGLARHLGIPLPFKKALAYLNSRTIISMDSFTINNQLSLNVSGIGFDGHVANLFGKNGRRGLLGYGQLVLREFLSYPEFEAEGWIDQKKFRQPVFILAFSNSSQFGNNARIAPHASVCDGWLDVSLVRKVPLLRSIDFARKMFTGRLETSSYVMIRQAKNISLTFSRAMPFHVDGEGMPPAREFKIQIHPNSIRMLVPENAQSKI